MCPPIISINFGQCHKNRAGFLFSLQSWNTVLAMMIRSQYLILRPSQIIDNKMKSDSNNGLFFKSAGNKIGFSLLKLSRSLGLSRVRSSWKMSTVVNILPRFP
jgi:hypothetical protein